MCKSLRQKLGHTKRHMWMLPYSRILWTKEKISRIKELISSIRMDWNPLCSCIKYSLFLYLDSLINQKIFFSLQWLWFSCFFSTWLHPLYQFGETVLWYGWFIQLGACRMSITISLQIWPWVISLFRHYVPHSNSMQL